MPKRPETHTIFQPLGVDAERTGEALRQPNERDETADDTARSDTLAPAQHEDMARARRDLAVGRGDTDCRSMPQAPGSPCAQPGPESGIADDVIAPDGQPARDSENRRGAAHDPGPRAPAPDGSPR